MMRKILRFLFPFPTPAAGRLEWVDYAKGICIIFVVMMHSTLGLEAAMGQQGFMHHVVEFAKPFRMPDFFLISGLFLARVIDRDWRSYLDSKVVHFAYFYVLWVTIQFAVKAYGMSATATPAEIAGQYLLAFVQPFGTLWFIYLLPIFFVVTKLARSYKVSPLLVFLSAATLEILPIETGSVVIDEFASRFVYFYVGYVAATQIFTYAEHVQARPVLALAGLVVWGFVNYAFVAMGWSELPFISLALGLIGATAIVTVSALLARIKFVNPIQYIGQNSLVIYLAFFLPMAASRAIIIKQGIITDPGWASVQVTLQGIVYPLIFLWLARKIRVTFLFERPKMFRLKKAPVNAPAAEAKPA
ncbi:inner membrane protein YcfT [Variibacter gotjawalensis]|uniref:Inner membrane protein YcfT n=1 Tax=Variibacter gotjawalensis TaxID=1333996 RepID=A0A0S3PQH9_9BRAD|nr:acyltransferase family protein [Variibacter gotjawalensis]NIK48487.1 putative membrane protein YcfT [Variibacter gotjawalensis]RZS50354.1 putative membrane protein YcfT [Variibacter gotjawalensis]BAT58187.1 inner membrane protein YcfT [Variibacter gotjawalensis]